MPHRNPPVMGSTQRRLFAKHSAAFMVQVYPSPQPSAPELLASSIIACFAESYGVSHVWSAASTSDEACSTA